MIKEKYPDVITAENENNYFILDLGGNNYLDEIANVKAEIKLNGGELYTIIDGEGDQIIYLKGVHLVNRLGYCAVRSKNE